MPSFITLFLALCLLPIAQGQESAPATDIETISIRMEGGAIERNTGEIVAALVEFGLVPLKTYNAEEAENPAQILVARLGWPEGTVTDGLSIALCKHNLHICSLVKDRAAWRMHKSPPPQTQFAFANAYQCDGDTMPAFVVCLPQVRVDAYTAVKRVVANPDLDDIGTKVTRQLHGCDNYDAQCKRIIERLNQGNKPQLRNGMVTMLLPARALNIQLEGNRERREQIETVRTSVLDMLRDRGGLTRASQDIRATVPLKARTQSAGSVIALAEPAALTTRTPLELMDYTRGSGPYVRNKPIGIGVWDSYVDAHHCVFARTGRSVIKYYDSTPIAPGMGTPPQGQCGQLREFGNDAFDHATFVSSLIVGQGTPPGVVGGDPDAELWQLEYVGKRVEENVIHSGVLHDDFPDDLHVINISQSFESKDDTSQSQLAFMLSEDGFMQNYVFVAAAGNDDRDYNNKRACEIIPACWSKNDPDKNTIISVVGLDAGGTRLMPKTNWGTDFDVAAIGDTTGAVYGGGYARFSGTSFAAPYVAALAAMLFERFERSSSKITALRVKQRILFTSTFIDGFEDKVRFGRISYGRALDFEKDVVHLRPQNCAGSACILRDLATRATSLKMLYALDERGAPVTDQILMMGDIKRLQASTLANGERRFWIVVRKDRHLRRYSAAKFADAMLAFKGAPPVALESIEDYTACSFSNFCDGDLVP